VNLGWNGLFCLAVKISEIHVDGFGVVVVGGVLKELSQGNKDETVGLGCCKCVGNKSRIK